MSGANLVKLHDRTISTLLHQSWVYLIQFLSLVKDKSTLYMLFAFCLVMAGLVLSYMPSHITGTTPKKAA